MWQSSSQPSPFDLYTRSMRTHTHTHTHTLTQTRTVLINNFQFDYRLDFLALDFPFEAAV